MKFVTKEFTIELLKENIISQKVNADCTELTIEGAIEATAKTSELAAMDNKLTKMITYIAPFYVKKEVINHLAGSLPESISSIATVCPGYISKYVASIAVKIYHRLHKGNGNQTEIKIFMKEDKAIEWLISK